MRRGSLAIRVALALALALALAMAGCGSDDRSSSGRQTLTWFIAQQPGGALDEITKRCSEQSGGRYEIELELLSANADQQREQLVRRLGAEDDSMDLLGLDVVWTGEFANAGWLAPIPRQTEEAITQNVFDSVIATAQFEDELVVAPIWSNTQLLWYRKDRVPDPPQTWGEMIDQAEKIGPAEGRIQVQANRYEGLTVLVNQLIESAGTSILSGPGEIQLERAPTEEALAVLGRLSNSPVAATNITTSTEDTARMGFEDGSASFMINYPFVYTSAKDNAPDVFKQIAAAKFPAVGDGEQGAPPIGGINIGVSAFSENPELAFDAVECLVGAENQLKVTELEGLPPVRSDLFDRAEIRKAYPGFADVIRRSIQDAAPRPSETPAYQDLSLAIQRAVHPTTDIDPQNPDEAYEKLRDRVEQAIKREGLL
ncbi:MAG: extracellular solute-binding protein [Solirubrobacterales bacterium]|nr:extracellular solute-binding protein [Solirubrobacterales bacterium]